MYRIPSYSFIYYAEDYISKNEFAVLWSQKKAEQSCTIFNFRNCSEVFLFKISLGFF